MTRLPLRLPRTLRARLLLGMLLLVTVGLAGTDLAAYLILRSYLYGHVDHQLSTVSNIPPAAAIGARPPDTLTRTQVAQLSKTVQRSGVHLLVLDAAGRTTSVLPEEPGQDPLAGSLPPGLAAGLRRHPEKPRAAEVGGVPYRLVLHEMTGSRALIIAVPTTYEAQTLWTLAEIEVAASLLAVLLLAGLAVTVLRVGLRPLGVMAGTATAIAEGDVERRIPVDQPGGEVGRLATALNRAFDERREAEASLRRFAADASHELRTPLTTIQGWADLYFQGGLPGPRDVETAMSRIADEAGAMSGIVEDLLLLARLDRQPSLDLSDVDLACLLRDVVADARVVDASRPISLAVPEEPLIVRGDAVRLRQVARNLVGNAVQHTPAGTPVHVVLDRSGDGEVTLTVSDEGPGIPEAEQARLFERFYRAQGSRSSRGTGLGLAIVQAIAHAHRGTVTVRSVPSTGSVFRVTLPSSS